MTVADLMGRFGEQHVTAFILVLARVSPLFVLAPMFSSKLAPAAGIVAVALAIGLSPVVSGRRPAHDGRDLARAQGDARGRGLRLSPSAAPPRARPAGSLIDTRSASPTAASSIR
jgi:hypothetical protein